MHTKKPKPEDSTSEKYKKKISLQYSTKTIMPNLIYHCEGRTDLFNLSALKYKTELMIHNTEMMFLT